MLQCCSAAGNGIGAAYFYIYRTTARGAELMRDDWHCLVTSWPAPGDVILINTGKLPPRWVGKWPPAEAAALWSAVHNPNLEIQSTIKPLKASKPGHGHVDIYWPCFLCAKAHQQVVMSVSYLVSQWVSQLVSAHVQKSYLKGLVRPSKAK